MQITITTSDPTAYGQVLQALGGSHTILREMGENQTRMVFDVENADSVLQLALLRGWPVQLDAGEPLTLKCVSHGADTPLQFIPDAAYPRLHRIDTIGSKGFLAQEAWYRVADVDTSGYFETPIPGSSPVYALEYPSWSFGQYPSGMFGIQGRQRQRVWYTESGDGLLVLADEAPKPYGIAASVAAGNRRRANVIDYRITPALLLALSGIFPGEDPGPRAQALLTDLDLAVRAYRATGETLTTAVADDATTTAHPWLLADLGGYTLLDQVLAELAPPSLGENVP